MKNPNYSEIGADPGAISARSSREEYCVYPKGYVDGETEHDPIRFADYLQLVREARDAAEPELTATQEAIAELFEEAAGLGRVLKREGHRIAPRHQDRDFTLSAPTDNETDVAFV